jgi:thiol-disulfide isomerase/thioredoxin
VAKPQAPRTKGHHMNTKAMALMAAVTCLVASGVLQAVEQSPQPQRTVAEVHPRLAIGALTFAKVTELPENVVLRAGSVQLRADEINRIVAAQPTQLQEDLRKNAYLVLEKQATSDILLAMAKKAQPAPGPESSKQEDRAIIQGYLQDAVLNKVQVTETDIKQLYEAEKAMLGGATLDQMYASLKQYLLNQKRQEAIRDFIRDLGKKTDIAVSQSWLASQAVLARDNPVDKARDSGKPSLVDFGATGCGPCDMMTPILEDLKVKYQGRLNVLFVHVRERQILGAKYGIQTIPVQVFFDKDGNEVFRHIGFFPQAEIEKRLAEMGATQ